MAHERLRVDSSELFLADRERDDRNVLSLEALIGELLVKGNVRVSVDRRNYGRPLARGELLDVGDDGLVVAVTERRVFLLDVVVAHSLGVEEVAEDLVRRPRIDVVGS